MKIIYLLLLIGLFGCQKEKEVTQTILQPDILSGTWYLKNYTFGFSKPPENYGANDVIWKFTNNNTLNVTINTILPANSNIPVTTTSQYSYIITNNILSFSNKIFPITIYQNNLIFDKESASDGERIVFVKI